MNDAFVSRVTEFIRKDDIPAAGPQGAEPARMRLVRADKARLPDRMDSDSA